MLAGLDARAVVGSTLTKSRSKRSLKGIEQGHHSIVVSK